MSANLTMHQKWNSQLTMIRSLLNITDDKLLSMDTQYQITTYDRTILIDLVDILTSFKSSTMCIQGQNTSSMVMSCIRVLKASMEELSKKYNSKCVYALKYSVYKRLSCCEELLQMSLQQTNVVGFSVL